MVHVRSLACAASIALSLILLSSTPIFSLADGMELTYTGEYSQPADGFFVIELENHGFDVNASITVTYTYACETGPEQHTSTTEVHHAELGTIWVSIPILPPSAPEMCYGTPTLDSIAVDIMSATPLHGQEANTPPTVDITTLYPLTGLAPLDVSAAGAGQDAEGEVVTWEWDFGDGAHYYGEGPTSEVAHTYDQAGTYLVFFKMWDDRGAVAYAFGKVRVISKDLTPSGGIRTSGKPVQYHEMAFDASGLFTTPLSGAIYHWCFGDGGTAVGELVSHEYGAPGTYDVTVATLLQGGHAIDSTITIAISENAAPVAAFEIRKEGNARLFDASGSSDPDGDELAFVWDFGDGGTAVGELVSHEYGAPGTYAIWLTVSDGHATGTAHLEAVVAGDTPPVATIAVKGAHKKGSELIFDATGSSDPDGDELAFVWDFGDGGTAVGGIVPYAYDAVGTYTVVLTVSDGTHTSTAFSSISVGNKRTNYLIYVLPLLGIMAALLMYIVKYGPKSTFEGLDLVRKDV